VSYCHHSAVYGIRKDDFKNQKSMFVHDINVYLKTIVLLMYLIYKNEAQEFPTVTKNSLSSPIYFF